MNSGQGWASVGDFLAMGGYGLFVWGSYAMAALVVVAEIVLARRRYRRAREDAAHAAATEIPR